MIWAGIVSYLNVLHLPLQFALFAVCLFLVLFVFTSPNIFTTNKVVGPFVWPDYLSLFVSFVCFCVAFCLASFIVCACSFGIVVTSLLSIVHNLIDCKRSF
jgi:hypothetical protein